MPHRASSIAVIGSGYWGKNLIRNYHELGVLRMICDKNEIVLSQFKEQYPDTEICLSIQDVLSRADIQGVVIATPAETHFVLAREALLAGKHVYVEKPLVLEENEAEELIALGKANGLILMVGHLLQYHPIFVKLRELTTAGELGRIHYIYSHRLNLGKIRREENILWSFAPHDISMILTLAGEEPEHILATGGNYLHHKIADVTTTHLEFPSGLRAHTFVSWLHPFKVQQLVVVGDRKMAVFDDIQPWQDKLLVYPHEIRWQNHIPVPGKAEPERFVIPQAEPLRLECETFLECIASGKKPITDGKEGLRVLKVLKAGQYSMNHRGAAVSPGETPVSGSKAFVHPSAVVDKGCVIGRDVKIWHFSHVLSGSTIGANCNIGQNVMIGPDVVIGRGCKIQNNVSVYLGVTLEDFVFCGPSVVFTNIYNPRAEIRKMDQVRPTLVKTGATLGANCTIVCGVTIGRYAFIGAGTVVTKNIPDHALIVGNPGVQIGWVCRCGERLSDGFSCTACNRLYSLSDGKMEER
ncbi:MAG: Gfo/Idh/MocA family oxidoreductase [Thermodesulfobacteriota bacterium]